MNKICNHFIDFIFGVDILLHFRTTIACDVSGEVIYQPHQIAKAYLKSRFILDLLATIPFDNIFVSLLGRNISGKLSLLSLLKLFRVLRLFKVISYMNASESIKYSLKIFKMLFYLIMYIHCQACAWFYITNLDQTWHSIEYYLMKGSSADSHHSFYDREQNGIVYQYIFSLYFSVNILLGEEMLPVTSAQAVLVSIALLVGEFIHAHIMGTIAVVMHSMSRKTTKFQEQIEVASSTMKNIKINESLQRQVQEYLTMKQSDLENQKELDNLLSLLSPSLRLRITQQVFLSCIRKI